MHKNHKNKSPLVSVIIVSYNVNNLLSDCLESLGKGTFKNLELIVIDNNSDDPPANLEKQYKEAKFTFLKENVGFSKANNLGAKKANGDFYLFLNPDTRVFPDSIFKLVDFALQEKNLGAVAPQLLNPDGTIQPSCFYLPTLGRAINEFYLKKKGSFLKYAPKSHSAVEIECAVGACLLIPKDVFKKMNGWDERYFMFFEDFEIARKIKSLGLQFWYLPQAKIFHIHGGSTSQIPDLSIKRLNAASKTYHGVVNHTLFKIIMWTSQKFNKFL
jgi:N-acetylglucosaminyl-diphospho-decaprenol L-rhamnosyltransferase